LETLYPHEWEVAIRLGVAALLGGCVGFEREYKDKPAGLRTHMMVSLGSACFMLVVLEILEGFPVGSTEGLTEARPTYSIVSDPSRVIQGIVGGIGFLCAGAIIRTGGSVSGLTTAGSLWLVGAVGVASGSGEYLLAGSAVIIALFVLYAIGWLEHRLGHKHVRRRDL
jgi:putative Mg2+ transporter-C (MgtC) family protein